MTEDDDDAALTISRRDLYELVWSKPLRTLAEDFGISDVALAKRCRRLGIPVPGRGYWARIDAGQAPHRPDLGEREPQWSDRAALTVPRGIDGRSGAAAEPPMSAELREMPTDWDAVDAAWLRERLANDACPEMAATVPARTRHWHPTIDRCRVRLEEAAGTLRDSRTAYERFEKLPERRRRTQFDDEGRAWRWVRNRGQRIADTHRAAAFRVSLGTYERALRLVNALALALTARGFTIEEDAAAGRIVALGYDARVEFRIAEILQYATRSRIRYDGKAELEKHLEPTGRLKLTVSADRSEGPTFADAPSKPLDDELTRIIRAVYRQVVKCRRGERELRAYWARAEEERRRQDEEARVRAQQEAAPAAERARRQQLSGEAARWVRAQRIRDYVAHLQRCARSPGDVGPALSEWSAWALRVAEEMDPTGRRLGEQSDGRGAP